MQIKLEEEDGNIDGVGDVDGEEEGVGGGEVIRGEEGVAKATG